MGTFSTISVQSRGRADGIAPNERKLRWSALGKGLPGLPRPSQIAEVGLNGTLRVHRESVMMLLYLFNTILRTATRLQRSCRTPSRPSPPIAFES